MSGEAPESKEPMSQREAYYLQRQVSGSQIPWGYFSDEHVPMAPTLPKTPPTVTTLPKTPPTETTLPKTPPKERLEQAERDEKTEEIESDGEGNKRRCFQDLSFTCTAFFQNNTIYSSFSRNL